jgi:thioredoxin-like negative regulator of GroEL
MYQINAMPTFVLLLNNREVGRMQGANVNQLEALIRSNIPAASSSLNNESIATKEERSWLEKFVHLAEGVR